MVYRSSSRKGAGGGERGMGDRGESRLLSRTRILWAIGRRIESGNYGEPAQYFHGLKRVGGWNRSSLREKTRSKLLKKRRSRPGDGMAPRGADQRAGKKKREGGEGGVLSSGSWGDLKRA